ncbi:SRPBCC domain-containing protein [Devosia sp. ZW T5_3]|uniref:SRPBCC domain-containing protein n=1 Tax=Devosia sp. ZW T5_3 TaxID=3378085 RepID=UPI003853E22D
MVDAVVTQSIEIAAAPEAVWSALIDRTKGRIWRSADFDTDWQPGSPISITAHIGSKRYKDKGTILECTQPSVLAYEFLPRISGLPDVPESYSRVTLRLMPSASGVTLSVSHTVPPSPVRRGKTFEIGPESGERHVAFYWRSTLPLIKDLVEERPSIALRMAMEATK